MHSLRSIRLLGPAIALSGAVTVAAACGNGDDPTVTVTTSPTAEVAATGTATAAATAQSPSQPIETATPHVVVTASPDEPVASTAYIPASELPVAVMTRADGETFTLPVEVPDRSEYNVGLSGRLELGERGMLFWYPEPTTQNFWMRNTHYDLSIAFVDGDERIVAIVDMEAESLETRGPGELYRYAIEAPVGWFAERGIEAGDLAVLDFEIPESLRG